MQVFKAKGLRHPSAGLHLSAGATFIPNDIQLGAAEAPFIILTGPNMGGIAPAHFPLCPYMGDLAPLRCPSTQAATFPSCSMPCWSLKYALHSDLPTCHANVSFSF